MRLEYKLGVAVLLQMSKRPLKSAPIGNACDHKNFKIGFMVDSPEGLN